MRYLFPITAINRDGGTKVLHSAADVLNFVSKYRNRYHITLVGEEWIRDGEALWSWRSNEPIENLWILRDDRGHPVDWKVFAPTRVHYKDRKGNFEHRNGPVPRLYHSRAGCKQDAPRKRHGGRGVLARAEAHRREFLEEMYGQRIRRSFYLD